MSTPTVEHRPAATSLPRVLTEALHQAVLSAVRRMTDTGLQQRVLAAEGRHITAEYDALARAQREVRLAEITSRPWRDEFGGLHCPTCGRFDPTHAGRGYPCICSAKPHHPHRRERPDRMTVLQLHVTGTPAPQGSKKGFVNPRTGRAIVVDDNKKPLKNWRQDVRAAALDAIANHTPTTGPWPFPLAGPVALHLAFTMPRPRAHYRTGKHAHELRPDAPTWCEKRPDVDKLTRAICDALTSAGVYGDDNQVAMLIAEKRYTSHQQPGPGVGITVAPLLSLPAASPFVALGTGSGVSAEPEQAALL